MTAETTATMLRSPRREPTLLLLLVVAIAVASRVLTHLSYVADPDSLRFALGLLDFDVPRLQPHFPGYPLFIALAGLARGVTGSMGVGFAIVGGIGSALAAIAVARLSGRGAAAIAAAAYVVVNPLVWVVGSRYMPDVLGLGVMALGAVLLVDPRRSIRRWGWILAGLLPGVRLSYLPFLLLPVLVAARRGWRGSERWEGPILALAALLLWLLPMIVMFGSTSLVDAAMLQTSGHFTDFGGAVTTEPDGVARMVALAESIVTDGLAGWWPGRHPVTIAAGIGALALALLGLTDQTFRRREGVRLIAASSLLYFLWIALFQNVIFQNRHLLPLIIPIAVAVGAGAVRLVERHRTVGTALLFLIVGLVGYVGWHLARQQREPTAVARITEELRRDNEQSRLIASSPLLLFMLERQGVAGRFLPVDDAGGVARLEQAVRDGEEVIVIGYYADHLRLDRKGERMMYYHNPYVNRVWAELPVVTFRRTEVGHAR